MIERYFEINERRTTIRREVLAGITTFMTMAYILFVNPSILTAIPDTDGLKLAPSAVLTSTAIVAAVATFAMGIFANVPIALAAGMGLNAVVAFQLVGSQELRWSEAMGVIVAEGALIAVLVLTGFREAVMRALPDAIKRAVALGIGLFLAFIGLVNAGFVSRASEGPVPVELGSDGHLHGVPILIFVFGFFLTAVLIVRRIPGAFLIGILATTAVAIAAGVANVPAKIVGAPDFSQLGWFDFGFVKVLGWGSAALIVFSVMLSDFFDTMGTTVAIGDQAGLLQPDGSLPRLRTILLIDSLAAMLGGAACASSATSYIESASGVAAGGRTGLSSIVCALCFALAMLFAPLAGVVPAVATAPALVLVGLLMMRGIGGLGWDDPAQALPAFLAMIVMPFTYSITNGIGAACISYVVLAVAGARWRDVHPLMAIVAVAFVVYFAV